MGAAVRLLNATTISNICWKVSFPTHPSQNTRIGIEPNPGIRLAEETCPYLSTTDLS